MSIAPESDTKESRESVQRTENNGTNTSNETEPSVVISKLKDGNNTNSEIDAAARKFKNSFFEVKQTIQRPQACSPTT